MYKKNFHKLHKEKLYIVTLHFCVGMIFCVLYRYNVIRVIMIICLFDRATYHVTCGTDENYERMTDMRSTISDNYYIDTSPCIVTLQFNISPIHVLSSRHRFSLSFYALKKRNAYVFFAITWCKKGENVSSEKSPVPINDSAIKLLSHESGKMRRSSKKKKKREANGVGRGACTGR